MTPPADRFARLRESWANVMNTDLDDAAGDARMIVEALPTLLTALDAAEARNIELEHECQDLEERLNVAEELATAVEIHCKARIAAHAPVPDRASVEWVQLNIAELTAWWRTKTLAEKYRDATK